MLSHRLQHRAYVGADDPGADAAGAAGVGAGLFVVVGVLVGGFVGWKIAGSVISVLGGSAFGGMIGDLVSPDSTAAKPPAESAESGLPDLHGLLGTEETRHEETHHEETPPSEETSEAMPLGEDFRSRTTVDVSVDPASSRPAALSEIAPSAVWDPATGTALDPVTGLTFSPYTIGESGPALAPETATAAETPAERDARLAKERAFGDAVAAEMARLGAKKPPPAPLAERVFRMESVPIVDRKGDLAFFVWHNSDAPSALQFVQSGGGRITHVDVNGKTLYDGDTTRVEPATLLELPARATLSVSLTVSPWQGPSVQLGIFGSGAETETPPPPVVSEEKKDTTPPPASEDTTGSPFDAAGYNLAGLNVYRTMHGVAALALDEKLSAFALEGSKETLSVHTPHTHFNREIMGVLGRKSTTGFGSIAGENQGDWNGMPLYDSDPVTNTKKQIDMALKLMHDEGPGGGHYEAMLNPSYHRVGIGLLPDAASRLYMTNDFSD